MTLLPELQALLADFASPWAVCGGYALEVFAGKTIRPHGDIDLCLPESARREIIRFLLRKGWHIYEYRGMGKVKPLRSPADSESGRNLMALRDGCGLVSFFPCEEEGLLYHRFTPGMMELNFLDLLFSPEMPQICHSASGLPILAPEAALLYKAAQPENESSQLDFAAVYPLLGSDQKAWLRAELNARYPDGHPWNK